MGKVIKNIAINKGTDAIEFLKQIYSVNTDFVEEKIENENKIYKNIEIDSILVNVEEEKQNIKISKLVSLKAFLLSKEQEMNINDLLYNINEVMSMSQSGLNKIDDSLAYDDKLKEFLLKANIEVIEDNGESVVLNDGKRSVKVDYTGKSLNFNTILELI